MENNFNDDDVQSNASGIHDDISGYLDDKFFVRGAKKVEPAPETEFEQYLNDKFGRKK